MNIINTTPHDVTVVMANGKQTIYPKSTCVVRVNATTELIRTEDGVDIYKEVLGEPVLQDPQNLLTQADNLLVSRIAAGKLKGNPVYEKYKIFIPGALIRDEFGVVIGCKGLIEV